MAFPPFVLTPAADKFGCSSGSNAFGAPLALARALLSPSPWKSAWGVYHFFESSISAEFGSLTSRGMRHPVQVDRNVIPGKYTPSYGRRFSLTFLRESVLSWCTLYPLGYRLAGDKLRQNIRIWLSPPDPWAMAHGKITSPSIRASTGPPYASKVTRSRNGHHSGRPGRDGAGARAPQRRSISSQNLSVPSLQRHQN